MGAYHTVIQGEYLAKIARAYGFANWKTIWDAPENKDLKAKRQNPNVLYPRDQVFIPDRELKEESRGTEKRHRFIFPGESLRLRLKIVDLKNQPLKDHRCALTVDGESEESVSKPDGLIEKQIPLDAGTGQLLDRGKPGKQPSFERRFTLKIGHLDPVDTVSGQLARLNNLGYFAGELPGHALTDSEAESLRKSFEFRSALEEFQCEYLGQNSLAVIKQEVDGICGKKTQAKLLEAHGC